MLGSTATFGLAWRNYALDGATIKTVITNVDGERSFRNNSSLFKSTLQPGRLTFQFEVEHSAHQNSCA
jgi:hypothetical protein